MEVKLSIWFPETVKKCEAELTQHYPKKTDSWKRMRLRDLITLLHQNVDKLNAATADWDFKEWSEADDQLIDVINVALMVAERRAPLKKQRKSPYVERVKK